MLFGKHINRYYVRYAPLLLLGIAALLMVDYMQLKVPELYGLLINAVNEKSVVIDGASVPFDMDFILDRICYPLFGIIFSMVLGRFLWRVCFFGAETMMEKNMRSRMFDRLKDLSQYYYQRSKVGNLMSLFTNDLETVHECFGSGILMSCDALFLGSLAIFKMFRMDPVLAGLSMIPMALLFAGALILSRYLTSAWRERQEAFSALSDFSQENFAGIAVIKAFVKETKELLAFRKLNEVNEKTNVRYAKLSTGMFITVTLLVETVICIILGYGGYLVWKGTFDAGNLVEFIGYFTAVVWPVMAVSQIVEMSSRGRASLQRIGELLEEEPDVVDRPDVTDPGPLRGDIRFEDLTFCYPGSDTEAMSHVSFSISAGENVGIVGKTGCGKTTLVDLILRTYNVPDGTLFLDGRDVNTIPIRTVRKYAAYVPQDNFLFSDTIANNIAFASDRVSRSAVEAAARLSDVHDNIMEFQDRYETVLGERGVTVSGGQKQRISIARALMKDASILILDDSVSAVDIETEKIILDNLKQLRKGKTTMLIAHRISTIEQMDKILFMEDGKVTAAGSHRELYETCPAYHSMVELQKLDELEKEEHHA